MLRGGNLHPAVGFIKPPPRYLFDIGMVLFTALSAEWVHLFATGNIKSHRFVYSKFAIFLSCVLKLSVVFL